MADNTVLNTGTGGDTIRDKDRAGVKTQIVALDLNPAGSETLMSGAMPVTDNSGSLTVDDGGASLTVDGTVATSSVPGTAADGGTLPATTYAVSGYDGTNVQVVKTDANGIVQTAVNGTVTVNGSGVTQPVSGSVTADTELTTADLDTGAGTDTRAVVGLVGSKSGGGVLIPGDATKGLAVDLTATGANTTALKVDGSAVTQPVSGTVTANAGTGTMAVSAASLPLPSGAATAAKQPALGTAGTASADVITVQGIASMTAVKVDGSAVTQPVSGTVTTNPAAATTGGATPSVTISAASTNATSVKASAGTLYSLMVSSINAAVRYLKLYNKASAPTVGTDTPVLVIPIPGNTAGAGVALDFGAAGVAFGTGIAFALTTGVANSDTGAVSANEHVVNLLYK